MELTRTTRLLTLAHSGYLLIGGLWPLLHMPSFEAVTGPKVDEFLVRSIALILLLTAGLLLSQLRKPRIEQSAVIMAMGVSLILGLVGVVSAAMGWIWKVYLLDGGFHLLFAFSWMALLIWSSGNAKKAVVPIGR